MTGQETNRQNRASLDEGKTGLSRYLDRLIHERGFKSYRAASMKLYEGKRHKDPGAFYRWIEKGATPSPASCRKIAITFGRTEAERLEIEDRLLVLAGHKTAGEPVLTDADIPPELRLLVDEIREKVPKDKRSQLLETIRGMIDMFGKG